MSQKGETRMSLLIKGEYLPDDCFACPCMRHDVRENAHAYRCNVTLEKVDDVPPDERPEWCPLVEIQPHGGLVDRNVLINEYRDRSAKCLAWKEKAEEEGDMASAARAEQGQVTFLEAGLILMDTPVVVEEEEEDDE